jgi:hypothetical protein
MQQVQIQLGGFIATLPDLLAGPVFKAALAAFVIWIGRYTRYSPCVQMLAA